VPKGDYKRMLEAAITVPARWWANPDPALLEAEIRAMSVSAPDQPTHGA